MSFVDFRDVNDCVQQQQQQQKGGGKGQENQCSQKPKIGVVTLFLTSFFQIDSSKLRCVDESEGRLWAESRGFLYFETSAQTGEGINEMFQVKKTTPCDVKNTAVLPHPFACLAAACVLLAHLDENSRVVGRGL